MRPFFSGRIMVTNFSDIPPGDFILLALLVMLWTCALYKIWKKVTSKPAFIYKEEPEPHYIQYDAPDGRCGIYMGNVADQELMPLLSVDVGEAWAEFIGCTKAEDPATYAELRAYYRRNGYFMLVCKQTESHFWGNYGNV